MSIEMESDNSKDTKNESKAEQGIDVIIAYFRDSSSPPALSEEEKYKAKQDMLRRIELRKIKREQMKRDGKVLTKHDKLF
jgi:hypothetical protein